MCSYETICEIEWRALSRDLETWRIVRDAYKTNKRKLVKAYKEKWSVEKEEAENLCDYLKGMVDQTEVVRKSRLSLDYDFFCLNKYKDVIPPDAVVVTRPGLWSNPCSREDYQTRERCVGAFEFQLARNRPLLARIDELKGKQLQCCCMPKICHSNVLAYVANSDRDTRLRWWKFVMSLDKPREIDSRTTLETLDLPYEARLSPDHEDDDSSRHSGDT